MNSCRKSMLSRSVSALRRWGGGGVFGPMLDYDVLSLLMLALALLAMNSSRLATSDSARVSRKKLAWT